MHEYRKLWIEKEALEWFRRRAADCCDEAEHTAFNAWLKQSPVHERLFREIEARAEGDVRFAEQSSEEDERLFQQRRQALNEAYHRDRRLRENMRRLDAIASRERRRFNRLLPWALMGMAAAAGMAVLYVNTRMSVPAPVTQAFATRVGEQRNVVLPDGSVLVLDTDTAAVMGFSATQRRVELTRGQAQFRVVYDPRRPFQVAAAGVAVKALGTKFQVRVEPQTLTVTLVEGKVAVEGSARSLARTVLLPGQRMQVAANGVTVAQVDLQEVDAWTRGRVHAENWRLADLLTELNRYTVLPLRLAEASVGELRVSGVYRTGDVSLLVRALENSLPVHAWVGPKGEIMFSHGPAPSGTGTQSRPPVRHD